MTLDMIDAIYKTLVENPRDKLLMCALADALEEWGNEKLALAYRWAAKHERWPFERPTTVGTASKNVYDWEANRPRHPQLTYPHPPQHSYIPRRMYHVLRNMDLKEKEYGDINCAFVLISKVITPEDLESPILDLTWEVVQKPIGPKTQLEFILTPNPTETQKEE